MLEGIKLPVVQGPEGQIKFRSGEVPRSASMTCFNGPCHHRLSQGVEKHAINTKGEWSNWKESGANSEGGEQVDKRTASPGGNADFRVRLSFRFTFLHFGDCLSCGHYLHSPLVLKMRFTTPCLC